MVIGRNSDLPGRLITCNWHINRGQVVYLSSVSQVSKNYEMISLAVFVMNSVVRFQKKT